MQQTEQRVIDVLNPKHELYEYLKDPRNYLSGVSGILADSNGVSATVSGFGKIRADITNLIEDEKIVMYSKDIGTSLTASLQELGSDKTRVTLSVISKPECGLIKNLAIKLAIPRLLDSVVEACELPTPIKGSGLPALCNPI